MLRAILIIIIGLLLAGAALLWIHRPAGSGEAVHDDLQRLGHDTGSGVRGAYDATEHDVKDATHRLLGEKPDAGSAPAAPPPAPAPAP